MQLKIFSNIVIINLWSKGLGVTHHAECSVALELQLSLIFRSSKISPSCGVILVCILYWFLLSFTIYMCVCCYQHHWPCFTPSTCPFFSKYLAFYFVFCLVTWLLAMKYGFCLQGRGRKVTQHFPPKYCVTPRALQILERSRLQCKHAVHWKSQIKIRQFPVVCVQGTEQSCLRQPRSVKEFIKNSADSQI